MEEEEAEKKKKDNVWFVCLMKVLSCYHVSFQILSADKEQEIGRQGQLWDILKGGEAVIVKDPFANAVDVVLVTYLDAILPATPNENLCLSWKLYFLISSRRDNIGV